MSLSSPSSPIRLGVLISGGGTTLQNLADQIAAGKLHARIACVISSNPNAFGLTRAANLHLPAHTITRKENPATFSDRITDTLRSHQVDLVCLAGFLALWTIPDEWLGPLGAQVPPRSPLPRVMNIHPALLPKFGGKGMHGHHVHEAVLAARETVSGCTVHFCDNSYDTGPIILQRTCPVLPTDTPDSLAARVFEQECLAYPEAIRLYTQHRLRLTNNTVHRL